MPYVRVALLGHVPTHVLIDAVRRARALCTRPERRNAAAPFARASALHGTVLGATVIADDARAQARTRARDEARGSADTQDLRTERRRRRPEGPPDGGYSLVAWAVGTRGAPVPGPWPWDEHLVLDADDGTVRRWRDHADVLTSRWPRPPGRSLRAAEELAAAHCGCLLAAVPRLGRGWSVAAPGARAYRVRTLCRRLDTPGHPHGQDAGPSTVHRHRHALLPSCLHGWLVAGHRLDALESATVVLRC